MTTTRTADSSITPPIIVASSTHTDTVRDRVIYRRNLDRVGQAASRWATLERLVKARGWPDRLVIALEQSLFDGAERAAYASEADISLATATSDLRRLLDAGLVTQVGRTRSTHYVASDQLRRETSRAPG